jgi:serine phosphatase RsbU (regulator of sigma subunit)
MVVRRDGAVDLLTGPSEPILGVVPEVARTQHTASLADGETLLLYTDGLVERRDEDLDDSLALLRGTLEGLQDQPLGVLCDTVLHRMGARPHDDDVVLVAVRPTSGGTA